MSRRNDEEEESWGPSHQHIDPPFHRSHPFASCFGAVLAFLLLMFVVGVTRATFDLGSGDPIGWTLGAVIALLVLRVLLTLGVGVLTRPPRRRPSPATLAPQKREPVAHIPPPTPATRVREGLQRVGGGAYLGIRDSQEWATADPETAAMILGPPRSGKTSAVMIPALMAASGPALSTSTKPDVIDATARARSEDRRDVAVRPVRHRAAPRRRAPPLVVPGQRRHHLGRGTRDSKSDDRRLPRRRGNDQ